jgi:hypothetical protein
VLSIVDILQLYRKGAILNLSLPCSVQAATACTSPEPDEYTLYPELPAVYQCVLVKQKFDFRKLILSISYERKSLFCDSLHVQYHLKWNASSTNKSNIRLIFMGGKCDLSHRRNNVF